MKIGERLKELRERRNITQKELAEFLDLDSQSISAAENNRRSLKAEEIIKIAEFLNVSVSSILGQKELETEFRWNQFERDEDIKEIEENLKEFFEEYENLQNIKGIKTKKFFPPKEGNVNWASYFHFYNFSIELAHKYYRKWEFGRYPSDNIMPVLENEGILVFCVDLGDFADSGIAVGDFGSSIIINKNNNPKYDYLNIGRQLFNLLTWEVQPKVKGDNKEFEKGANTFAYHLFVPDKMIHEESSKILNFRGGELAVSDLVSVVSKFKIPISEMIDDERVHGHLLIPSAQSRKSKGIYVEEIIKSKSSLIDTLAGITERKIKELPALFVNKVLVAFQLGQISEEKATTILKVEDLENFVRGYFDTDEDMEFKLSDLLWRI